MAKKARNEVLVGAFVILGLVILSLVIFFVSGVYFFRPGYAVNVMYEYVSVLDKGAPVRIAGVRVGEVSRIHLVHDEKTQKIRVRVKLFIEKGVEIGENYLFRIRGTHILSEPHIEVTPEPGDAPLLQGGETIEGISPIPIESLIHKADEIAQALGAILTDVKETIEDTQTRDSLRKMLENLNTLTDSLNQVLVGSEEDMKVTISNMSSATGNLDAVLRQLNEGEGTFGKMLRDDELYQEMRELVAEIKARPWRLLKRDDEKGKKFLFF